MSGVNTSPPFAPPAPLAGLPGSPDGGGDIHLLDRLSVIYRYRTVVMTVVALMVVAGIIQTYTTIPEYQARAQVEINRDRPDVQGLMVIDDDEYFLATKVSILGSRDLARRIVKPLNLANNPEISGQGQQALGLIAEARAQVSRLLNVFSSSKTREVEAANASRDAAARDTEGDLAGALIKHVTVSQHNNSNLVDVTVVARDAEFSAAAANAVVDTFVEQNLEIKRQGIDSKMAQYDEQIAALETLTTEDRKNINTYRQNAASPELLNTALSSQRVTTFQQLADQANERERAARERSQRLSKLNLDSPLSLGEVEFTKDLNVAAARERLRELTDLLDVEHTAGKGDALPEIIRLNANIDSRKKELHEAMQHTVDSAKAEWDDARRGANQAAGALANYQQQASKMADKGITFEFLENQEKTDTENFNSLRQLRNGLKIEQDGVTNNIRVTERAVTPATAFNMDHSKSLLIALASGVALALVLAFGLDYLDDTIKTPEDVTRRLHVPFLGLVPSVHGDREPMLSGPVPHDFGEAYRALRTSLVFMSSSESTRILCITSAQPLEGKTTTACNLAMVLAFGGSRVLLIDADMRRPSIHKALKINNTVGLSHLLVGQARVRESIQRTSDTNFYVMTAGRTPPNPSELLASDRMRQLVANLKQGPFDWVIFDTPPVLAVTDAVIITPLVDCSVFVLGAEMTRRRLAERAVHMLLASKPKLMGAVLNRVNFDRNKYYYSRYHGYQYKSYYGTPSDAAPTAHEA